VAHEFAKETNLSHSGRLAARCCFMHQECVLRLLGGDALMAAMKACDFSSDEDRWSVGMQTGGLM
jgi:hypothetical protein